VTVVVNGEVKYRGSTSKISHKADAVFAWLGFIAPIKPGTVAGFGTMGRTASGAPRRGCT
jgi:2-keto-4-pentenoate hydratase/2-oxohepta-3-ene-1,7-dioic acid hydratase in catechol pathway